MNGSTVNYKNKTCVRQTRFCTKLYKKFIIKYTDINAVKQGWSKVSYQI